MTSNLTMCSLLLSAHINAPMADPWVRRSGHADCGTDDVDVCGEVLFKGAFLGAFTEVWPATIADSLVAGGVKAI